MRRVRQLALSVALIVACSSGGESAGGDAPTKETPADEAEETKEPDAAGSSSGADEPEPSPIDVDAANRFVKEDLDRFLDQYPQAVRKQDAELFRCEVHRFVSRVLRARRRSVRPARASRRASTARRPDP